MVNALHIAHVSTDNTSFRNKDESEIYLNIQILPHREQIKCLL
jgi:hypothetical protein